MRTDAEWLVALERQADFVDTLSLYVEARKARGVDHESSSLRLSEEKRLYRRLMGRCPVEVLFRHAATSVALRSTE